MNKKRMLELLRAFYYFIEEELSEEDNKKWFFDMFGVTAQEQAEILKED